MGGAPETLPLYIKPEQREGLKAFLGSIFLEANPDNAGSHQMDKIKLKMNAEKLKKAQKAKSKGDCWDTEVKNWKDWLDGKGEEELKAWLGKPECRKQFWMNQTVKDFILDD